MTNFGTIKRHITEQLTLSLLSENKDNNKKKLFENFIKEIKNSDILKTEYCVYSNIENQFIDNENKATRYINENINLFKNFKYENLIKENKRLFENFPMNESEEKCPCITKLHENLDTLIKESLKKESDINKKYNSFEVVLEYIMTENASKKDEDKHKIVNETFFSINYIINSAINKFNDKYSYFNDNEKEIFKVLFEDDNSGKKEVFNKIKKDNINLIKRKIVEAENTELSDKLKLTEDKLNSMGYDENNYIEDIIKLNKLNSIF